MLDDHFHQGNQVLTLFFQFKLCNSLFCYCINKRKFDLLIGCFQVDKQFVDFVQNLIRPCVSAIDFVDHDNDFQSCFQSLAQHKTCLRKRSLRCVHQQKRPIHHHQRTFHFSAEIRMTRSIKNIDFDLTPSNRTVFGRYRDSPFLFKVHVIHQSFTDLLIFPEKPCLTEHLVDKGGFAMVNMGNDGNVADRSIGAQGFLFGENETNLTD